MLESDSYKGDITAHMLVGLLFEAWRTESPDLRADVASRPPPGPIALRCRYHHLIDSEREGNPLAPVSEEEWNRALVVETEGDNALRVGDFDRAITLFREVEDGRGFDLVSSANARLGIGEAHRARGDVEGASRWFEAALHSAGQAGYRFGRLRALIALGYLALHHHSVVRAREVFDEALDLAVALGDGVYHANAVQGLAECAERDGATDDALAGYQRAHELFREIRSLTGQAHVAQRIGALHHRRGRADLARDWLVDAAKAFAEDNDPVGMVNTLDGLGDILLDVDDPDAAEVQYQAAQEIALDRELPLALAHSAQNFARVAAARQEWTVAEDLFQAAIAEYRTAGDLLGVCTALGKRAAVRKRAGRAEDALTDRVAAVFAIEEFRAANREPRAQLEYRGRFAAVYAHALRTAVSSGSAERFAVVSDGLAGRRLPGLAEAVIPAGIRDNVTLTQDLVVRANQRWAADPRGPGASSMGSRAGITKQERVRQLLGNAALRGAMPGMAKDAIDDLLAAVYLPPADDGAALLAALPSECHVLQLVPDPEDPALIHRLWRDDRGRFELDTIELGPKCLELIALLQENNDERSGLCPRRLLSLSALLPERLPEALADMPMPRLLLLPVGELWLVPWGAVPVREDKLLAQAAEYVVCPSMSLQRVLRNRGPARPIDGPTGIWRSPVMDFLGLSALDCDPRWWLNEPLRAVLATGLLADGTHTVILTCHGRPADGPGHYLELDEGIWLLPADVLGPVAPARLYLITCWGAGVPGQAMADPITIATLALARGSAEVLATVGEFGDTKVGNLFAESVLGLLADTDTVASAAVHQAGKRLARETGAWEWPLRDWASLLPIGTFMK